MTRLPEDVEALVHALDVAQPRIAARDNRYNGNVPLHYAADEIKDPALKWFHVNLCRLAVDAIAERMRVKHVDVTARGHDVSAAIWNVWRASQMDQLLLPFLVDVLALGSAFLIVWPDQRGRVRITPESAKQMAVSRHPVTGETLAAVKRWNVARADGTITEEHAVHYRPDVIVRYRRDYSGDWIEDDRIPNALGVVPVVPVVNFARIGDTSGVSVLDDLGPLVDALSKVLADMLVASEDVARPRRWATGVDLEEDPGDGFTADGGGFIVDPRDAVDAAERPDPRDTAVSPFESGDRMFTVESPDAKFGQLPGADLQGYRTAVDLLVQQIMAVSALPAHMMGVTGSNISADAFRAAEASLTARADARINVIGMSLERALALAAAIGSGVDPEDVEVAIHWANPSARSLASEADSAVKLHAEGVITTEEARAVVEAAGLTPAK